ncbi:hypothetical protein [Xanthomonas phage RTH11]|nr:hypothetical protein [Xanthomonas phage RTH11]
MNGKYEGPGAFLKNYLEEKAKEPKPPKRMSRHPHALEEDEPTMSLDSSMDLLYIHDELIIDEDDIRPYGPEFDFE